MTRMSRRPSFPTLPMLLFAGLFLGACSGGNSDTSVTSPPPSPQQIVAQLAQQGYLKASNTNTNASFGFDVALSGDTLAVGARGEASNATGVNGNQADKSTPSSGAVYVFTRTGGVWTQQAYLKASNTDAGDEFGSRVVLDGDTLAVGARGEASNATGVNGSQADNSTPSSGAVYVFTRTGGVWTQQAYLKASNTHAGDWFGSSMTLDGDTLTVGAPFEASTATGVNGNQADTSAPGSGAAYVFTRTGGVWTQQAYLKASNTHAGNWFGRAVALDSDTLAVSASQEVSSATGVNGNQADTSAPGSGAAYVFTRTGGVWTQQAYLKPSNTDAGDLFGESLALDGDTVVVGARFEASAATGVNGNQADNSAFNSGAAYVFTRTGGVWTQQAYLKASNAGKHQNFGGSAAIAGDIVAVGARLESNDATGLNGNQGNSNAPDSGAVYVFTRTAGVWSQQTYVKASNTDASDQFGESVALSGNTLVVPAPFEASSATGVNGNQADNSAPNSGAVYVFQSLAGQ